jgi:hypothetical protein
MLPNRPRRIAVAAVACALVAGLVFPAGAFGVPFGGESDSSALDSSASAIGDDPDKSVSVAVDCEAGVVQASAPASVEYRLQTAVVAVSSTATATSRTARGPLAGNATVGFDGTGLAHAFVTNASTGQVLARTVADCTEATETTAASGVASVGIDCNESAVRVAASSDVRYDVRVTAVRISPTRQSVTSVTTGPYTGNATVQFSGLGGGTESDGVNATVYAFVSTEDGAASDVATCPAANATTQRRATTPGVTTENATPADGRAPIRNA